MIRRDGIGPGCGLGRDGRLGRMYSLAIVHTRGTWLVVLHMDGKACAILHEAPRHMWMVAIDW